MTAAGIWFLVLIFGLPALGGLGSLLLRRGQHRHELRLLRLQALQEALRHPQLDEETRRQILAVLGREQSGVTMAMLLQGVYITFLCIAWLMFFAGGVCWILSEIQDWGWRDQEPAMAATIIGFALLTLPVAVRELLRRERVRAPAGQ